VFNGHGPVRRHRLRPSFPPLLLTLAVPRARRIMGVVAVPSRLSPDLGISYPISGSLMRWITAVFVDPA